jgi:PIN like domain
VSRIFFTDRDLGKQFPAILSSAGLAVERHADLFAPDGSDEQWLEYCGRNQRIAISHNLRIRYTPNELAAVMRHGVALLIVIGDCRLAGLASNFVNSMQRIEVFVATHQPPYIAKVYRASPADLARNPTAKGAISLWYPA